MTFKVKVFQLLSELLALNYLYFAQVLSILALVALVFSVTATTDPVDEHGKLNLYYQVNGV
jgi:hypothetical protein